MPRELQGNKNVNPSQVIIEREILQKWASKKLQNHNSYVRKYQFTRLIK